MSRITRRLSSAVVLCAALFSLAGASSALADNPGLSAIGLETLLSAALRLYHNGEIALMPLLRAMTISPAKLLGLPAGRLEKGAPADLIVVDLGQPWVVDKALLKARSKNSPFDESKMQGRVLQTMVGGEIVFKYGAPGLSAR